MRSGAAVGLVVGLIVVVSASHPRRVAAVTDPCEGPGAVAWLTEYRDRVVGRDALFQFAAKTFGAPTSCEGGTFDFDGTTYGGVVLTLPQDARFWSMTQPPRALVVRIEARSGFPDEAVARDVIEGYARTSGLAIDWGVSDVEEQRGLRREQYWDPDPGMNGSVTLVFDRGRLVQVELAMAP